MNRPVCMPLLLLPAWFSTRNTNVLRVPMSMVLRDVACKIVVVDVVPIGAIVFVCHFSCVKSQAGRRSALIKQRVRMDLLSSTRSAQTVPSSIGTISM